MVARVGRRSYRAHSLGDERRDGWPFETRFAVVIPRSLRDQHEAVPAIGGMGFFVPLRKAWQHPLWLLALGACELSSTDNTAPAGGAFQTSTSQRGESGGGSATGTDTGSSGNVASGGAITVVDGAAFDAPAIGTDGATDTSPGDDSARRSGDGGSCAGLFCEDFEEGQIDPAKWDVKMGAGGMEMVQQETVAHGKYAWHVHGTGAAGDFAMILTKTAPAALQGAGPVFGRANFYATPINGAHVELGFAGTMGYPKLNYMEFAAFSNSWQLGFDLFVPAPSIASGFVEEASYPHPSSPVPTMTWSCIEWEFGDNPDMMVLWVDGKQIDQLDVQHIDFTTAPRTPGSVLNGKSSGIIGGFSVFGFGFHSWGASKAFDLYYDDIVIDTKRVNCMK